MMFSGEANLESQERGEVRRGSTMNGWIHASAAYTARAIQAGEVSSVEVISAYLERIDAINPRLNAVVQTTAEVALQRAREADMALARGVVWGPLHGVPMTIKDSFETAGVVTTAGTKGLESYTPARDASVVARLRSAGAILLGKTNVPEITLHFTTDNYVYGRTNNPYDPARIPAGSSGGAAAIVAACGSSFDIGSDTGGSIRIPAHFCGIAGLKPTAGRVPRTGHIPFLEFGATEAFTQVGPLARWVEDLTLILSIITGPDGVDPAVVPMPLRDPASVELKALRVTYYSDIGLAPPPSAETSVAVQDATAALAEVGASVREAYPPGVDNAPSLWFEIFVADGGAGVRRLLEKLGTKRMHPFIEWTQQGEDLPSSEYSQLLVRWNQLLSDALAFFENYDVIICPVNATPATLHGEPTPFKYTYLYNLLGWPVAVVRCATSPEGLPIGVQIVARPWREDVALAVAGFFENTFGGWQEPAI
jgi:amidase